MNRPNCTPTRHISARQREILNCLIAAVDNTEAAAWLRITPTQVGRQKARIIKRLGAETFPQAVIIAYDLGLVDLKVLPPSGDPSVI